MSANIPSRNVLPITARGTNCVDVFIVLCSLVVVAVDVVSMRSHACSK